MSSSQISVPMTNDWHGGWEIDDLREALGVLYDRGVRTFSAAEVKDVMGVSNGSRIGAVLWAEQPGEFNKNEPLRPFQVKKIGETETGANEFRLSKVDDGNNDDPDDGVIGS